MLASNSLQPPKSGTSRYSKALPAVPGLNDSTTLPPPPPSKPRRKELPVPPKKDVSDTTPFSPPSSVTSPISSVSTPTSTISRKPIPRRAVGASGSQSKSSTLPTMESTSQTQNTAQSQTLKAPSPAADQGPRSPSESLSSFLSAYSRSTTGSPVLSSEGTVSLRDSQQTSSPSYQETSPAASTTSASVLKPLTIDPLPVTSDWSLDIIDSYGQAPDVPQKGAVQSPAKSLQPPPPPPAKDGRPKAHLPTSPRPEHSTFAPKAPQPAIPAQTDSSPPRSQIWRRRSVNLSKDLPELKLHSSHGSTAATASLSTRQAESETASVLTQSTSETIKPTPTPSKPLPPVNGLPGRDIRPVNARQPSSDDSRSMGSGVSRAKRSSDELHMSPASAGSPAVVKTEPTVRPTQARPPTPEYHKQDIKSPIMDTFVSPVSPASSPEPQSDSLPLPKAPLSGLIKDLPLPPPPSMPEKQPIARKAVGSAASSDLHSARSVPNFRSATSSPATEPLPSLPSAASSVGTSILSKASPSPSDAGPSKRPDSDEGSRLQLRGASAKPEGRRGMAVSSPLPHTPRMFNTSPENDPRLVRSKSGNMLYRGRDGTLYPEMKENQHTDAEIAQFPMAGHEVVAEGTVLPAPPVRKSHYVCYQKHRTMGRRTNRQYPLACQTCHRADAEDRWVCTFCQLRMCAPCFDTFNSKQRDLERLLDAVKMSNPPAVLTLSSSERPGSALGLTA